MSENKRYYYLKLKETFFTSETIMILENMPDGLIYSNLLLKMYLMSLKDEGQLLLNSHIPHTPRTIATCTNNEEGTVKRGIEIFRELGLVEQLSRSFLPVTELTDAVVYSVLIIVLLFRPTGLLGKKIHEKV